MYGIESTHANIFLDFIFSQGLILLAATREWASQTATMSLGDELGVSDANEQEAYAAMDWLLKRQPAIEQCDSPSENNNIQGEPRIPQGTISCAGASAVQKVVVSDTGSGEICYSRARTLLILLACLDASA